MTVLVDTCVLVDALNHRAGRHEFLLGIAGQGHVLASCAVTVCEVYAGMRPAESRRTAAWFASFRYFDIPESTAKLAGDLRSAWKKKGRDLPSTDTLIAAVAIEFGLVLATDNVKDFPMPELRLLKPPRLN